MLFSRRKHKRDLACAISDEDVRNALPKDEDFRQSLIMPSLMDRFPILGPSWPARQEAAVIRQYRQPNLDMLFSMPSKASSVLTGTRQRYPAHIPNSQRASDDYTRYFTGRCPASEPQTCAKCTTEQEHTMPSLITLIKSHLHTRHTSQSAACDEVQHLEALETQLQDMIIDEYQRRGSDTAADAPWKRHRRHTTPPSPAISIPPKNPLRASARQDIGQVVLVNLPVSSSDTRSGTTTVPLALTVPSSYAPSSASHDQAISKPYRPRGRIWSTQRVSTRVRRIRPQDISSPTLISCTNVDPTVPIGRANQEMETAKHTPTTS